MSKKIGIGYDKYKKFIDEDLYYIDKTLLVRDIINSGGEVTLCTRPRRFGKTLALSMLRTFFEAEYDNEGKLVDNSRYFAGTKILHEGEQYLEKMGKYPVISISLKSAKQPDFSSAFFCIRDEIIREFSRHSYLKSMMKGDSKKIREFEFFEYGVTRWDDKELSFKSEEERERALKIEYAKYSTAIKTLSDFLKTYQGEDVIILIDEYDVPLENAYHEGFYHEMVNFIRSLFESALKSNDSLAFAVVTGCLRISKESIFTGLNNMKTNSILSDEFSESFGFTPNEVTAMLKDYDLSEKLDEVKKWYDGYSFGKSEVYNPWSVINYVDSKVNGKREYPGMYWSNTSSNSIVRTLIENASESVKNDLAELMAGREIEKRIHEDVTYDDIDKSEDNLWNFLFFTGYLKKVSEKMIGQEFYISVKIPNLEIAGIYNDHIKEWYDNRIKQADFSGFYQSIRSADTENMENFINGLLSKNISYFDEEESFYHGFFLSLLHGMSDYTPKSNREEGDGRPDIVLYPERPRDAAYIFELKVRKKFNEMDDGIKEAFDQILQKKYVEGILDDGYAGAVACGICFCKKSCVVELF